MLRKKSIELGMILSSLLFLFACGQAENENSQEVSSQINTDPLNVEIIAPEEVEPDTELNLQALVTQGEEKVNDASEVKFEVWQRGQKEQSELIDGELSDEEGVYEITYHFKEENLYFVQPHVTARGTHMMPVAEIKVGDVPEEVEEETGSDSEKNHEDDHES